MASFKLPTVRLPGRPVQAPPKKQALMPASVTSAPRVPAQQTLGLAPVQSAVKHHPTGTFLPYPVKPDNTPFVLRDTFVDCARETVSKIIEIGVMGESAARDLYKEYNAHIERLGTDDPIPDILLYRWKDSPKEMDFIASQINDSVGLQFLDLSVQKLAALDPTVFGDESANKFFYRMSSPILCGSNKDFFVVGLANPFLKKHVERGFRSEFDDGTYGFLFFALVSAAAIEDAMRLLSTR